MATTFEERLARISATPNATAAPLPGDISHSDPKQLQKEGKASRRRNRGKRVPLVPVLLTMALLAGLAMIGNPTLLGDADGSIAFLDTLNQR